MKYYVEENSVFDATSPFGKTEKGVSTRLVARCEEVKMAEKICGFLNWQYEEEKKNSKEIRT